MTDQDAWARLLITSPREKYEHVKTWTRRNRRRASFVRRITRDPATACWLWTGQVSRFNGREYPITSFRVQPGNKQQQRSAFAWLVHEFLPEFEPMTRHRTSPGCGQQRCINPWHRVDRRVTRRSITADDARAIYARRNEPPQAVASCYGISKDQVLSIWRGRNWRSATGAPTHEPRRRVYSDDEVEAVMALKGTGLSSRQAAAQVGVHYKFVLSVWAGLRTRQDA